MLDMEVIKALFLLGGVPLIIIEVILAVLENKTVQKKFDKVLEYFLRLIILN